MGNYDISFKATGDVMTALSAAVTAAKALNLEHIFVDCRDGITVTASKESRVVDLFQIYQLEKKIKDKK